MRIVRALARNILICAALLLPLLHVNTSAAQVTLAWDANTEPDIAGYKIYYSSGGAYSFLDVGNTTTATVPNLLEGATYTFYATAYNSAGLESASSTSVLYNTQTSPPAPEPPLITSQPLSQIVTVGDRLLLSITVANSLLPKFQWSLNGLDIPNAIASTYEVAAVQATDAGSYLVRVQSSGGTTTSEPAIVTVKSLATGNPPKIVIPPKGGSFPAGSIINLSVTAWSQSPLTFQWYKDGIALSSATFPRMQITTANAADSGSYTVMVANTDGAIVSPPVKVVIEAAPLIVQQPVGNQVPAGSAFFLTVAARGAEPLSYQWFRDNTPIPGATAATYAVPVAGGSDSASYNAKVSNSFGEVQSDPVRVTVEAGGPLVIPPAILKQPEAAQISAGFPVTLSVTASGTGPLSYQWYRDGTAIDAAMNEQLTLPFADPKDSGTYTVAVSNSAGSVTSLPTMVQVFAPPVLSGLPIQEVMSAGTPLTLTASVTGSEPLSFQWFHGNVPISGASGSTFRIPSLQRSDSGTYTVIVSNPAGTVDGILATIEVWEAPLILSAPKSQSLTFGSPLKLAVQTSGSGEIKFQWFKNNDPILNATNASFEILSTGLADAGSYAVAVSNPVGSVKSEPATISIIADRPSILIQPISQTLVAGVPLSLSVQTAGTQPFQYQWTRDGLLLPGATASVYRLPSVQESDSGSYAVTVSNSAGSATTLPALITVVVPPKILAQPSSQIVGLGAAVRLSLEVSGSKPMQCQWMHNGMSIPGANSDILEIPAAQFEDAGSYLVKISNSAANITSVPATLTVLNPPQIVSQPTSQTVSAGAPFALSVEATGSSLRYQWFHGGLAIQEGTNPTLQLASAQISDGGSYTVTVSNSVGSVESQPALVTVISGPTVTRQPQSQTLAPGSTLVLSVEVSGSSPFEYQWFRNGTELPTATSPTYRVDRVQAGDAGLYTAKVSNSAGSLVSAEAMITVLSAPNITVQPVSQTLVSGANLTLSVQASGTSALQYQWFRNDSAINGATAATLTIGAVQDSQAGVYTVKVSNEAGSVTSAPANVSVLTAPRITLQPVNQTVTPGATVAFSVGASGSGPLQYQWFRNNATIAGATSATFSIPSAQSNNAGSYIVQVSNEAGSITSEVANLEVLNAPVILIQPLSQTLVPGTALTLSVEASGSGPLEFQWFRNDAAISGATAAILRIAAIQDAQAGSYTVKVGNKAGSVTSTPATVTVLTAPNITLQPTGRTIRAGDDLRLVVQAFGSGTLKYEWFRDGLSLSGMISDALDIPTAGQKDAGTYTVKISNEAGVVTSSPAVVTVIDPPNITQQPAAQTLPAGAALKLEVQASGSGPLAYQWSHDGKTISGQDSSTLSIASIQGADAGVYTVQISNQAGTITSLPALVKVLEPPVIGIQPIGQKLVSGTDLLLAVSASGAGQLRYQWFRDGLLLPGAESASLRISSSQTTDSGLYTVAVSNEAGAVMTAPARIIVQDAPKIKASPTNQLAQLGAAVTLTVDATGSKPLNYEWYHDGTLIPGTASPTLRIPTMNTASAGRYSVKVSNEAGTVISATAQIQLLAPPEIVVQPVSQLLHLGSPLVLSVLATSSEVAQYQWFKDGVPLSIATSSTFTRSAAEVADAGQYQVKIWNTAGEVTSEPATIVFQGEPAFTQQPTSQIVISGATVVFSAAATGAEPLTYQWFHNGTPIPGATATSLTFMATTNLAGTYNVAASNPLGSVVSEDATVDFPATGQSPLPQKTGEVTIDKMDNSKLMLRALGSPGSAYLIEASNEIPAKEWFLVKIGLASPTGLIQFTPADATAAGAKFYRVVVEEP